MKNILLSIFLLCTFGHVNGQTDIALLLHKLDKIKKIEDKLQRDSQLIWQYNYITEELARNQDSRTEAYLDTLKFLSELGIWDKKLGLYYRAMGRYNDFKGNFPDALVYYNKAIEALKHTGSDFKEIAFTYVLKGFLLSNSEKYQECKKTLNEGLVYANKAQSKNSLCLIIDWFGDFYYYGLQDTIDNNLALEYYLQVKELLPHISYARIIGDNHSVLSGVYGRLGRQTESDYHFIIADSICQSHNLPHVRWGLYAERARVLEENGLHEEANKFYLLADQFMTSSTNIEFKSRLEKALYNNYKNLNSYELALKHYEAFTEMEKQMANDEVSKKYAEIEAKYDLTLKDKILSDLQKNKLTIIRNLTLVIISILVISIFLIISKNKQLKKNYAQLEFRQEEIEQAIYMGETQERQRLSYELHDNVNTKLVAAKWRLEAIAERLEETNKEVVQSTIDMIGSAYDDVRNISHNLVPSQLESEGLIGSIENLFNKLNINDSASFELVTDKVEELAISKIRYPVYNIIFELINNVLKHAQASKTLVNISLYDNTLQITVNDNGTGFDHENIKHSFGLKSISNRVKALSGKMQIKSNSDHGTITSINIPIV